MDTRSVTSSNDAFAHTVTTLRDSRLNRTWTVAPDGSADFASIADAVAAATAGDTIAVGAGLYLESLHIDKAVHLVGPSDPRFVEDSHDADQEPYALIMGSGTQTVRWTAEGGSLRDLVISRVPELPGDAPAPALVRMDVGNLRIERSILADGAQCAVDCRGGNVELVRCHVRHVSVGVRAMNATVTLERTHIEATDLLALHLLADTTATLVDNSFEGETVLEGDVRRFEGNDIDTLRVHSSVGAGCNRISSLIRVCDFPSATPRAMSS